MNRTVAFLGLMAGSSLAPLVHAQSNVAMVPGTPVQAEAGDIIVTAQKRSERLQDVPLSIAAATGEQLEKAGVASAADLVKIVPGFTYQQSNYGTPVFGIRGISFSDPSTGISPTVSVYVDQVALPYLVMTPGATLDLERVEVLKGPQGTLFGQNSTGGAINFIAAKPTKSLSFGGSAEYARFGQYNLEGFVSGPLSDTLAIRVAARTEQGGAWQKSLTRPDDELGDRDFTTGRVLLDWNPSDNVRFELNANGFIDKSDTLAAQYVRFSPTVPTPLADATLDLIEARGNVPAPENNRSADWVAGDKYRSNNKFYQISLRGDIDVSDDTSLTSITAYSNLSYNSLNSPAGVNVGNVVVRTISDIEAFSQELRLAGTSFDRKLRWMVGGNYGRDNADEGQLVSFEMASNAGLPTGTWFNAPVSTFTPTQRNVDNQKIETWAAFGSLEYQLTSTFSASGSIRYTKRNNDGTGCLADSGDGRIVSAFNLLFGGTAQPGECFTYSSTTFQQVGSVTYPLHEDNLSWRANLSWKPSSDTLFYGNVTKGYKAGSFSNLPLVFDNQYRPVKQEAVLAYEAGFKTSALDRTLNISGAAFYYDYSDKQIAGYTFIPPFGNLPALISIPKSRVKGAELNLEWRPVEGLTLSTGATYVDSRVKRGSAYDPLGNLINIAGEAFPITPKWQLTGDAEYGFAVSSGLDAYVGASFNHHSSAPSAFGGDADFTLPAYTLVDLRVGIKSENGRWSAQLWGRNIFNEFYLTNVSKVVDTVARNTGRPATYGVKMSFRY